MLPHTPHVVEYLSVSAQRNSDGSCVVNANKIDYVTRMIVPRHIATVHNPPGDPVESLVELVAAAARQLLREEADEALGSL